MNRTATITGKGLLLLALFFSVRVPFGYADDFFFNSAGANIHYVVEGTGEPVLLIHGFGGDIQKGWADSGIIKDLSVNYKVIAMDVRGHGRSDKSHDPGFYGMELVQDVLRLLDHLEIPKAHIVGYSMGGMMTLSILGAHAERLLSAAIGGAGWFPPQEDPVPAVRKQLADSLEQGKGIEPLILSLIPEGDPPPSAGQMAMANKMFLANNDALALAALQRNSPPPPTETQLRAIRIPVLALVGEKDARKMGTDNLSALLPHLKVVVIPGANHVTAPLSPEFKKSLRAFLDDHSAARKPLLR